MPKKSATLDFQEPAKLHTATKQDVPDRVRRNTAQQVQARIDADTHESIKLHSGLGHEAISLRLKELDKEWPVDRALMAGISFNVLLGLLLGKTVSPKWYLFPAIVGSFLLQHTLQGWCPPLPIFRRLGFRTAREINLERTALKALRGDYDNLSSAEPDQDGRVDRAMAAASY